MIRRLLAGALRRFETRYRYDAAYMHEIVAADLAAGVRLMLATGYLSHRGHLPPACYFAAKLRSARMADCGPCLELVIAMAEEAGVPPHVVLAALGEGEGDAQVEMVVAYADAVLANAPELPAIVDDVRAAFGTHGLAGLAAAVVAGQFYPTLKRGMGHATACAPVVRAYVGRHARERLPAETKEPSLG